VSFLSSEIDRAKPSNQYQNHFVHDFSGNAGHSQRKGWATSLLSLTALFITPHVGTIIVKILREDQGSRLIKNTCLYENHAQKKRGIGPITRPLIKLINLHHSLNAHQ
jgi:hypothetical protein